MSRDRPPRPRRARPARDLRPVLLPTAAAALAVAVLPVPAAQAVIVGGDRIAPSARPAVVRLAEACTATLVAPRRLLTAGHCVSHVTPGETVVRIGGARYVAARVARHPRYQYLTPDFPAEPYRDVGLVELDRDVAGVTPVPIARHRVPAGATVELTGYGTGTPDEPGNYGVLRRATLVVRSAGVCRQELGRAASGQGEQYRDRVMLCTQDPDGRRPFVSGCFGDSGAPLTRRTPRGRTVLVGVDSWGVACGARDGDPEVFSRVSAERRFVESREPGWTTSPIEEPFAPGRF